MAPTPSHITVYLACVLALSGCSRDEFIVNVDSITVVPDVTECAVRVREKMLLQWDEPTALCTVQSGNFTCTMRHNDCGKTNERDMIKAVDDALTGEAERIQLLQTLRNAILP